MYGAAKSNILMRLCRCILFMVGRVESPWTWQKTPGQIDTQLRPFYLNSDPTNEINKCDTGYKLGRTQSTKHTKLNNRPQMPGRYPSESLATPITPLPLPHQISDKDIIINSVNLAEPASISPTKPRPTRPPIKSSQSAPGLCPTMRTLRIHHLFSNQVADGVSCCRCKIKVPSKSQTICSICGQARHVMCSRPHTHTDQQHYQVYVLSITSTTTKHN